MGAYYNIPPQRKKKFMLIDGQVVVNAQDIGGGCWLTLTYTRGDADSFTTVRYVNEPSYVELFESLKDYKRKKDAPTE